MGFIAHQVLQEHNCCREESSLWSGFGACSNRAEEWGWPSAVPAHVLCYSPFTLSPVTAHTQVSVNRVGGIAFMTAALSCKQKEKGVCELLPAPNSLVPWLPCFLSGLPGFRKGPGKEPVLVYPLLWLIKGLFIYSAAQVFIQQVLTPLLARFSAPC